MEHQFQIAHRFSTAYHPRGNGLAERVVQTAKQVTFKMTEGNFSQFDDVLPFVQLAINLKYSDKLASAPFCLFYGFQQPQDNASRTHLTEEELLDRFVDMQNVILPALSDRISQKNKAKEAKFNRTKRLVTFKPGSYVMLKNTQKNPPTGTPKWTGPFKILSQNRGGSYVLETLDGTLHPTNAAPSLLKNISHSQSDDQSYEIQAIINHCMTADGKTEYLVKWKNYNNTENTWEQFENFNSLEDIQDYWRRRGITSPHSRQRLEGGDVENQPQESQSKSKPSRKSQRKKKK